MIRRIRRTQKTWYMCRIPFTWKTFSDPSLAETISIVTGKWFARHPWSVKVCLALKSCNSTIWISYIFHIISLHGKIWTQQIDLTPNVLLHSSVGRASHRYRGGDGFESRWSPDILQASSFQFLKLENLLRWSFFAFSYVTIQMANVTH